ncbi:MAG: hypothetical protein IT176_15160 [Acidobacteria bacterium]|nr:hypothetical protein [Acidobacteriota bacterium]
MLDGDSRPRVSRDTRRLITAAALALVCLWVLARLRFPDAPLQSPVAPVLTQISRPATFADLADQLEEVKGRIAASLVPVPRSARGGSSDEGLAAWAWPLRDDVALLRLPDEAARDDSVLAVDRPTGLGVIRAGSNPAPRRTWEPAAIDAPTYLFASAPTGRLTIAPFYVDGLNAVRSPAWSTAVWRAPDGIRLAGGSFVFNAAGEWLGMALDEEGQSLIVPARALRDRAQRMLDAPGAAPGSLGMSVRALTPALAAATGSPGGVVVDGVDGPAAGVVSIGDVVEMVDGQSVATTFEWRVRAERLAAGAAAVLRVRRGGEVLDVTVIASPPPEPAAPAPAAESGDPGLRLARAARVGSRVVRVTAGSAADRAGLRANDVIVRAGADAAPTPEQVRRQIEAAGGGGTTLLVVVRGAEHLLVTLSR